MKIRVHDTMGRSLITIQDIMENPDEADKKLAELKEAVSILSDSQAPPDGDIADEMKNCEKLGVRLILHGYPPKDPGLERIVIPATRARNIYRGRHSGAARHLFCHDNQRWRKAERADHRGQRTLVAEKERRGGWR